MADKRTTDPTDVGTPPAEGSFGALGLPCSSYVLKETRRVPVDEVLVASNRFDLERYDALLRMLVRHRVESGDTVFLGVSV